MELSHHLYQRLLRALAQPHDGEDLRRHQRIALASQAQILPISDEQSDWLRVYVADLSPVGLSVVHARPMTIGGEFILQIPKLDSETPTFVHCLVRSSTLVGEGCFRICAEFVAEDTKLKCLMSLGAGFND